MPTRLEQNQLSKASAVVAAGSATARQTAVKRNNETSKRQEARDVQTLMSGKVVLAEPGRPLMAT
jgi:biotin carboxyl carrier protein